MTFARPTGRACYPEYAKFLIFLIRQLLRDISYLQNITDDTHTPHVCAEGDRFILDHFWCHEFWGPEQYTQLFLGIKFSRQTKVDDFHSVSSLGQTQDVLRLKLNDCLNLYRHADNVVEWTMVYKLDDSYRVSFGYLMTSLPAFRNLFELLISICNKLGENGSELCGVANYCNTTKNKK